MSNPNPATKKEALLAELLGDVHLLLEKVELTAKRVAELDGGLVQSTTALVAATTEHRKTLDETVATIRRETARMLSENTAHAAKEFVGQQAQVLEHAAIQTIQGPVFVSWKKENRQTIAIAVVAASFLSAILTAALLKLLAH